MKTYKHLFEQLCGFDNLWAALLAAALAEEAIPGEQDAYGQRYVVDFLMHGPRGQALVRSSWIVRAGEDIPRLTSCFVR
jgi:hypothetical protein